ncbi:MAG TPA: hypothetical protein VGX78_20315, partial [Pirellulales bacterium]|nr:hypothetical protein [Pirellulales bacterium]
MSRPLQRKRNLTRAPRLKVHRQRLFETLEERALLSTTPAASNSLAANQALSSAAQDASDSSKFIHLAYQDLLARAPDAGGL